MEDLTSVHLMILVWGCMAFCCAFWWLWNKVEDIRNSYADAHYSKNMAMKKMSPIIKQMNDL